MKNSKLKIQKTVIFAGFFMGALLLFGGARGVSGQEVSGGSPSESASASGAVSGVSTSTAVPEGPSYTYKGDQYRDPFISLEGGGAQAIGPKSEVGVFNPAGLDLRGIIKTPSSRWAILRGTSGDAYIVQNGRIHDPKRKIVEGYVGIVKEKSLVIIGPNNQVTEIKLKKDKEQEKI